MEKIQKSRRMNKSYPKQGLISGLLQKTATDSLRWSMPTLETGRVITISFLNQHGVNTAHRVPAFYSFLMESDYLLRDGIGVKIALKLFGEPATENLNGTDLISRLIPYYKEYRIALFGASEDAIQSCRARLENEGVSHIVAAENGFHADEFYVDLCERARPDIIILCMGMPRQELLAAKLKKAGIARLLVCGGGWADFYSGVKTRAPDWMQKISLEWLHRLVSEPRRLGKRYTVDIIYYFYLLFLAKQGRA